MGDLLARWAQGVQRWPRWVQVLAAVAVGWCVVIAIAAMASPKPENVSLTSPTTTVERTTTTHRPTTTTSTSTTMATTTTTVPPTTVPPTAPPTTAPPTTAAPPPPPPPPPTVAPAPPPAQGGCDPNYTGCVPIASDVDCSGGSGNGPAYVSGPVTVVGSDVYGLDADGDGVGCE
jgi:hypothetical protein